MMGFAFLFALTAGWMPGDDVMLDDPQKGQAMDFSVDMADRVAFERVLAEDVEHTAKVVRLGGVSTLLVDGHPAEPILFKGHSAGGDGNVFAGKPMSDAGVRLLVANANFRGSPWHPESPWTKGGFDPEMVVEKLRRSMLTATNALWLVTLRVDPPMDYVYWHPDEGWRTKDGGWVYGNGVATGRVCPTLEPQDPKCPPAKREWPWVSMCSRRWRREMKANIDATIARMKETGLSKRIVGVHMAGFHDAQFATAHEDRSASANAEFAASGEKDYDRFFKKWPQHLIDEFAEQVKKSFGKDVVVLRWCMGAFGASYHSSHDIWEFVESKWTDGLVPQAMYSLRAKGMPLGVKIPHSSLHLHGKLLVTEHDIYNWMVRNPDRPKWFDNMVSRAKNPDDFRVINRKLAGAMIARRMGWWYFEVSGSGWYTPPEVNAEVKSTVAMARDAYLSSKRAWHPLAALVVDSDSLLSLQHSDECGQAKYLLDDLVREIARSGVPFDSYLARDFDCHPEIMSSYKAVLRYTSQTPKMDADAIRRFVSDKGGYVPVSVGGVVSVDMNGNFLSVHALKDGKVDFTLPFDCRVLNLKSRAFEPVVDGKFPLDVKKGETCWFSFEPDDQRML